MLNNNTSAMEDQYANNYVQNYVDVMDNLPQSVQRDVTKMRELDIDYNILLTEIKDLLKDLATKKSNGNADAPAVKRILVQVQNKLIQSQELADDKIDAVQNILDRLEDANQSLTADARKYDETENERGDGSSRTDKNEGQERPSKRQRRARVEGTGAPGISSLSNTIASITNLGVTNTITSSTALQGSPVNAQGNANLNIDRVLRQDSPHNNDRGASSKNNTNKTGSAKKPTTKKKKRRAAAARVDREDSPTDIPIDPDEPTYCLCEQVSYGEMIGCDNDLCPIEWFHFSCVSLTNKPKGKWYCPKCRGDKATVMKPKAVLNKELMQYNKEKEERS